VRSVEQPVNLDDGNDVYNWPWLYAVQVGEWTLTDAQESAPIIFYAADLSRTISTRRRVGRVCGGDEARFP